MGFGRPTNQEERFNIILPETQLMPVCHPTSNEGGKPTTAIVLLLASEQVTANRERVRHETGRAVSSHVGYIENIRLLAQHVGAG